MASQPKGGMQFFKKFADKGGSLFGGMKIKGPKQTKAVAQTQTNFNFTDKSSEDSGNAPTRDDIGIKNEYKEMDRSVEVEAKVEEPNIKKNKSKNEESIKKVQNIEKEIKKIEESPSQVKEVKQLKEIVRQSPKQTKEIKQVKKEVIQTKEPSEKVIPAQQKKGVGERKKSQKLPVKRSDNESTGRKPSSTIKQQKKRQQQKAKKSDREQVLDQINQYNLKLAQSVINQKNTQHKISHIRGLVSELRQKMSHYASQQSLCAQREEYQEADRLQTQIEEAQNKIDEMELQMNIFEDQLLKQEGEEVTILRNQNGSIKKIGRKLKLIELQLQDDASAIKREEIQKIQTMKSKQQAQRKKMQRLQKDITHQNEQITQLQKIFKSELDNKLSPLIKEKGVLEANKADLQNEIKELEKKLKEKKAQLADANKQLKSVGDNINQINQSFRQQNTKLQQRKNKLEIAENEHEEMQSQLNMIQRQIQDHSHLMEEKVEKKLGEALQMAALAKSIQQKQATFDDQIQFRRVAYDNYIQNAKILKQFEDSHREEKQKIKELSLKKASISSQISKLQQKRDSIRKKLPQVEAEQKKFADVKNFKAAGLKKTEIKQMNDELQRIKEKIQACVIEEHSLTVQEDKLRNAQKNNLQEEEELRKNLATSQYHFAQIKLKKTIEYQESLTKNGHFKEKEKVLKELAEVISKITEEINYLNAEYNFSEKENDQTEEEHNIIVDDNASDQNIEEEEAEGQNVDNNEENNQEDLAQHQELEQQRDIEEQQDSGYVPLQLD